MFTHVSLLKSQIEALSKLQTSLLSVIECNEHVYEEMNQKLYEMFDRFDFKNNFWIYEGFLQMLSYFSVIKSTNLRIYDRIKPILNELIMNHEMKDTFKVSTIYGIFEKNLTLLLYLYEIHFLDFTMIELQAKKSFDSFFFFLPEIKSENMDLYEKLVIHYQHSHEEVLKYCQDNINPKFWDNRKFGHSPELLAKIIMDDDLDSFIDYISKTADFDLNSRVNDSISEYIRDIKNLYDDVDLTGISLIEYSMAFGSLQIFKYLWLNKVNVTEKSLKFAIIGGNKEIILIIEEKFQLTNNVSLLLTSREYHQTNITDYLLASIDETFLSNQLGTCINFYDFTRMMELPFFSMLSDTNETNFNIITKTIVEAISSILSDKEIDSIIPYIFINFLVQSGNYDFDGKECVQFST